jgi:hypothetical protein
VLYIFGLCVYRLYFHPLSKFPGPKLAAVSDFWICSRWYGSNFVLGGMDLIPKVKSKVENLIQFRIGGYWPREIEKVHREYGKLEGFKVRKLSNYYSI